MDFEHVLKKNIEKSIEMVCLSHLESKRDEHFFFFWFYEILSDLSQDLHDFYKAH